MNHFPQPPESLTTRQVECISCRELFVVSEDQYRNHRGHTREWRLVTNTYPETQLRYQPDRRRRPITPESRAEPVHDFDPLPNPFGDYVYINCPRCGADNRNWVKIRFEEKFHRVLENKNSWFTIGLGLAIILAILAFFVSSNYSHLEETLAYKYRIAFAVVVLIAGTVPLWIIPLRWREWRDFIHSQTVVKERSLWRKIPPPFRRSLTLFVVLVVGVPLLAFVALPWLLDEVQTAVLAEPNMPLIEQVDELRVSLDEANLESGEDTAVVQAALNELNTIALVSGEACSASKVVPIAADVEALPRTGLAQPVVEALNRATNDLNQVIATSGSFCRSNWMDAALHDLQIAADASQFCVSLSCPLHKRQIREQYDKLIALDPFRADTPVGVELSEMGEIEEVLDANIALLSRSDEPGTVAYITKQVDLIHNALEAEEVNWFTVGVTFLNDWGWFTALASFMAITIAVATTDNYIRRVDKQLPRPVYYSVSNMMRVALWEANRALEIGDVVRRIQWTTIRRNEKGGVDLIGLFRDPPEVVDGRLQTKVRAQEYRIRTDRWCKIEDAIVVDKQVDVPANSPIFVHTEDVSAGSDQRVAL